jgi:hypothetical protein
MGIFANTGQPRRALFRMGDPASGLSLQVGERIGEWRVAEIKTDQVVLEAFGRREVLDLYARPGWRETGAAKP